MADAPTLTQAQADLQAAQAEVATATAAAAETKTIEAWATELQVAEHIFSGAMVYSKWSTGLVLTQADFQAGIDAFTGCSFGFRPKSANPELVKNTQQVPQVMQARYFGAPKGAPLGLAGAPKKGPPSQAEAKANAKKAGDRLRALAGLPIPQPKASK